MGRFEERNIGVVKQRKGAFAANSDGDGGGSKGQSDRICYASNDEEERGKDNSDKRIGLGKRKTGGGG